MAIYLITGGCGFIGSHLAEAVLARGDRVRILDDLSTGKRENMPPGCELLVGDVADGKVVAEAMAGVDGCWHLAAVASVTRSNEDWVGTHRTNLTGSIQIMNAARGEKPIPVVYASSAAVFGDNPDIPLRETAATAPQTAYGADKLGTELHARVATGVHGVPTVGFRFFNVYGPRQDPKSPYSGVISIFLDRIRMGVPLPVFGDGLQSRDFIHVKDVVRFLLAGMGRGQRQSEVFNVCTGVQTTLLELADTLFTVCGRTVPIDHQPARIGDIRFSAGHPGKARDGLGLTADTPLRHGLRDTLDYK